MLNVVLILIVVEDGLVLVINLQILFNMESLNPYCSGRWSRTILSLRQFMHVAFGLNPYCSGRWSRTLQL